MKIFICILFFAAFLLPLGVSAQEPIGLMVNGRAPDNLPTPPVIREDRMLVPARAVFESLGATVQWRPAERSVYIQHQDKNVVVTIDRSTLMINGQPTEMPIPAQIINDNTMIPVGAVAMNLGFSVDFRDRTVFVDSPDTDEDDEADDYEENGDNLYNQDNDDMPLLPPNSVPADTSQPNLSQPDTSQPGTAGLPLGPTFAVPPGQVVPAIDRSTAQIPTIPHPAAAVFFVGTPQPGGPQVFTIVASSPITGVQRLLLPDNRLAIDIVNSTTNLTGPLPVPAHLAVRGIRASQFEELTTRVVFDLESGTEFSIDISPDRTTVFLSIHQNTLTGFEFAAGDGYDTIVLTGVNPASLRVVPRTGRRQIYISNTQLQYTFEGPQGGEFVHRGTLSQWSPHIALLDLDVYAFTAHTITQTGVNETTIHLHRATYRNIHYDYETRTFRIPRTDDFSFDPSNAVRFDLYHNRQFVLWLPIHGADHLGFGEKLIADSLLHSVAITHSAQGTQLNFSGNQIFAIDLQEDGNYYIIRVMHPRERYSRIVIIDPGHGGRFPGAVRRNAAGADIREAQLNLEVTRKLLQLIEADGIIRAYTTQINDVHLHYDHATDLRMRPEFGNPIGDMFISIHFNSVTGTHIHGTETYYRESVHDQFRLLTNRQLAEIMHRHLLGNLGTNDREVRPANFAVLRYSTIPAALLEIEFMSNPYAFARLQTPEFQWAAARAIYNGLLEAFNWIPARPTQ